MKNMYTKSFKQQGFLMILVLMCSATFSARATAVWTNAGLNGIWSDATNWTGATGGGGLPAAGDDVLIPNSAPGNPVLDAGDICKSLTIESMHTVTVDAGGYDLTVGTSGISGGGVLDLTNFATSASITVGGSISIASLKLGTTNVIVAGNFTVGTLTPGSSSTVTLNGVSLQNISANTFHSLVDNNSGSGSNIGTLTGDISVTGNITGTGALAMGTHNMTVAGNISGISLNAGSGTLTLTGNLAISTFISGTSTVILNGTARQLQNAFTFNNLEIDNTGTSETFFDDQSIKGTLSGTGTLDGGSITVTCSGDITIDSIIENATKYFLSGNTANQNITKGYTFYELHINNTASSNPGATLTGGDVTVDHLFSLDNGLMTLGNNNLIISTPVTGLTGTPSATSYVKTNGTGALVWTATTGGTIFPVGDASYNPIKIEPQSSDDIFYVQAIDGVTDASNVQATTNTVNVTWTVKPTTAASQGVLVTPQWTSSNPNQELPGFNHSSSSDYVAYRTSTSSTWTPTTAGTPNNLTPIFSLQSGNPGGVSDITMTNGGNTYYIGLGNGSPLPVTLVAFNAVYKDGHVNLDWKTASEINNSHFEVERSVDGANWMMIGMEQGHGNSQTMQFYAMVDGLQGIVPAGTFYYRLKQVDFNGQFAYSEIKSVNIASPAASVETYPNPTADVLNVSWTSSNDVVSIITIKDLNGKQIYSAEVTGNGANTKQIDMTSFKTGTYYVQLVSGNDVTSKMVLRK